MLSVDNVYVDDANMLYVLACAYISFHQLIQSEIKQDITLFSVKLKKISFKVSLLTFWPFGREIENR